MEEFYKNAGIAINKLCEYVPGFEKTANYKTLTGYGNPRNGTNLKNNLKELFLLYKNLIPLDDDVFKEAMANILMEDKFNLTVKKYNKKYSSIFIRYCLIGG